MGNYCSSSEHYRGGSVEADFERLPGDGHYSNSSVPPRDALSPNTTPTVNIYTSTIPYHGFKQQANPVEKGYL